MADRSHASLYSNTDPLQSTERLRENQNGSELAAIAASYVSGVSIDWNTQSYPASIRRVCLPTYAFQGEEFWVGTTPKKPSSSAIHSRPRQTFEDAWGISHADSLLIGEHQIFGASVMPGVGWMHFATATAQK